MLHRLRDRFPRSFPVADLADWYVLAHSPRARVPRFRAVVSDVDEDSTQYFVTPTKADAHSEIDLGLRQEDRSGSARWRVPGACH